MGQNKSSHIESLSESSIDNGIFDDYSPKYVLKLLDSTNMLLHKQVCKWFF